MGPGILLHNVPTTTLLFIVTALAFGAAVSRCTQNIIGLETLFGSFGQSCKGTSDLSAHNAALRFVYKLRSCLLNSFAFFFHKFSTWKPVN